MVTFEVTEGTYHDLVLGVVPLVPLLEALVILNLANHGFHSLVSMLLKDGHGGQAIEVGDDPMSNMYACMAFAMAETITWSKSASDRTLASMTLSLR